MTIGNDRWGIFLKGTEIEWGGRSSGDVSSDEHKLAEQIRKIDHLKVSPTSRYKMADHIHTYIVDRSGTLIYADPREQYGIFPFGQHIGRTLDEMNLPGGLYESLSDILEDTVRGRPFEGEVRARVDGKNVSLFIETSPMSYLDSEEVDAVVFTLIDKGMMERRSMLTEALSQINEGSGPPGNWPMSSLGHLGASRRRWGAKTSSFSKERITNGPFMAIAEAMRRAKTFLADSAPVDIADHVIRTRVPYLISDVTCEDKIDIENTIGMGTMALAIFPISLMGTTEGVLVLTWPHVIDHFTKEEIEFGMEVSDLLSMAVKRAEHEHFMENDILQLRTMLDGTDACIAFLDEGLRLVSSNKAFDRMHPVRKERSRTSSLLDMPLSDELKAALRGSIDLGGTYEVRSCTSS